MNLFAEYRLHHTHTVKALICFNLDWRTDSSNFIRKPHTYGLGLDEMKYNLKYSICITVGMPTRFTTLLYSELYSLNTIQSKLCTISAWSQSSFYR